MDLEVAIEMALYAAQVEKERKRAEEALVRNIGAFSRFLDIAADQSGKIVNYAIARCSGVRGAAIKG